MPFVPRQVDAEGYSDFRLWQLMEEFGSRMHIGMPKLPFEAKIFIVP